MNKLLVFTFLIIGFIIGVITGNFTSNYDSKKIWQKEIISRGFGQYNQNTGVFEWKDK